MSSLDGVNIGDVVGWAPTSDVLGTSKNLCTNKAFSGFTLIPNSPANDENENDVALKQLLDGETDALWIYADQAHNYVSECENDADQSWDCDLWKRFGTDFAYVQTGIYDYMNSGTTLAISKKGSGLATTLNPCIEAYIETESYYTICKKYGLEADCFHLRASTRLSRNCRLTKMVCRPSLTQCWTTRRRSMRNALPSQKLLKSAQLDVRQRFLA